MDLSYATIPVFGGEFRRLYREVQMAYLVSDSRHPNNHPIYSVDENIGSCVLQLNDEFERVLKVQKDIPIQVKREEPKACGRCISMVHQVKKGQEQEYY